MVYFILLYEFGFTESDIIVPSLSPIKSVKRDFSTWSLPAVAVLLLTLSFYFPGLTRQRKIHCVIDEIHSDWESSLIDFNQDIFGILAENSYHSFVDYLRRFYQVTILTNKLNRGPLLTGVETAHHNTITASVLNTLKDHYPDTQMTLILKCITTPFNHEEIEAIKDFVFQGGNVFFIGDHTDVFFMNKNLNELSKFFGIRFKRNSVYFVDGGWVITNSSDYRRHPTTHYLKEFIWATGDSLKLEPPAFPLIYSPHVCFADEVNYFYNNFFGNTKIDAEEIFGSFCLMAGAKYGKGKVLAFSDSTCFNNYLMFTAGRRDLIAGIFGWFGETYNINPFPWLSLIAFCVLFILYIKRKPNLNVLLYQIITAATVGWIIGYLISNALNCFIYPRPRPGLPLPPQVILDASHGPRYCLSYGNSEWFLSPTSYDNLLYNIGRVDIFPKLLFNQKISQKILNEISCLVIACPMKKFFKKEKNNIEYYIKNGESLLLIEGANPDSTVNQVANLFDIHIRLDPYRNIIGKIKEALLTDPKKEGLSLNPAWVEGGEIAFKYDAMPIVCYKRVGKGLILVIGDDGLFMKKNFKHFEKKLVNLQGSIIKALVNKDEKLLRSIDWNYLVD